MVKRFALAVLASSLIPAGAFAAPAANEVGYPAGSLAVQSIGAGNYADAERVLAPVSREDASDPARLINIGLVYLRTGRMAEARVALDAAKAAPDASLMLSDGREVSSKVIAANLLRSLDMRYAAR